MLDKEGLLQLVHSLYVLTKEQSDCIQEVRIHDFLSLSYERQPLIQSLVDACQNQEAKMFLSQGELASLIQEIMNRDQSNIEQIAEMMKETQDQLRSMTAGRNAFYAYVGKDTSQYQEESHFIDQQMV